MSGAMTLFPSTVEDRDREVPEVIRDLVKRKALFCVNSSAGKDSQAMLHFVRRHVPDDQIVILHAVLDGVEWDGVQEHLEATAMGLPILKCRSRRTLLQMVEERGMFPSPRQRQCTSDTKRGPLEKTIRHTGAKLIVNCMGMRAEESSSRAKLQTFKYSDRNSKNGREWYEWLPIHEWVVEEVWEMIRSVGQEPHWAYGKGMSRLSCCFCIMSSRSDLRTAALLNPALYKRYVELERQIGQVMMMPSKTHGKQTLEEVTGILAT